jgi:membrane protease YdiL (CAAX protease family)
MTPNANDWKTWCNIAIFVALVFALTVSATLLLANAAIPLRLKFTFGMWIPAMCGTAVTLFTGGKLSSLGLFTSGGRWLLAAFLLPIGYALPVYVLAWATGLGGFDPSRWAPAVPYVSAPTDTGIALALLLTVGLFDKFSRALGEEIGWRGFLVPQCLKVLPLVHTGLFTGTIWALWHVPAIVLMGYNAGNIPISYQLACFFVMVIASGVFFAWLRSVSQSVWPCAVLHAAHNLLIQSIFDQATVNGPYTLYVVGEFGAGLALTASATAFLVLTLYNRRTISLAPTRPA